MGAGREGVSSSEVAVRALSAAATRARSAPLDYELTLPMMCSTVTKRM